LDKAWFPGSKAAELYTKYVDAGAGFVYIPAIVPDKPTEWEQKLDLKGLFKNQQYVGRWLKVKEGNFVIGHIYTAKNLFNNITWAEELLKGLRKKLPDDVPIILQALVHGADPSRWAKHIQRLSELEPDIIELNTGCPVGLMSVVDARTLPPEAKWGMAMGAIPEVLFPVVEAAVKATDVPVGFKLTPESGYPRMLYIAEGAAKLGAKHVVTTHKYFAVAPPDIWNGGKPTFPALDANCPGDMGGPVLRLSMYKATSLISLNIPKIQCFAGGGITRPEHVAEAIMLGAPACQTLTGIVTNGIKFITKTNCWLKSYMEKCGYSKIKDFKGKALKYIKSTQETPFPFDLAKVDKAKCTGCGKCSESYCPAIVMVNNPSGKPKKVPKIDADLCSCCGMCAFICPSDAITYVARK
jgi:dihydropyrimidine dehydrogenase (NAD+) subunit PreA